MSNSMEAVMAEFITWRSRLWETSAEQNDAWVAYNRAFDNPKTDPQVLASLKMFQLDKSDTTRLLERVVDAMRVYIDKEYGPFA